MMELFLKDIGQAIRSLSRRRGYALAAIVTLGLGVAANTTVFSLVYGTLYRQPPFPDADRLVVVYRTAAEAGRPPTMFRWSYRRFEELRREARSFTGLAAFGRAGVNLGSDDGDPEQTATELVSASYFPILGVAAAVGRVFAAEEDSTPGTHPVAVISHALWLRRFGGERTVLGRSVRVSGEILTVIGVMPPGFAGLTGRADLWIPEMMAPRVTYREHLTTDQNFISVMGRLRPEVTLDQVRAELAVLGERIERALPDDDDVPTQWSATAIPLSEARIDGGNRRAVLFLLGAVGFLLLLACANVAGLGLAHAIARRQEVTVRLTLGASRGRLIRQLMTESTLLGLVAGGLGAVAAAFLIKLVRAPASIAGPANMWGTLGDFAVIRLDLRVLAFTLAATVTAVILSGLVPALHASRTDLATELKDRSGGFGGGGDGSGRSTGRLQSGLVVAEIALALVLSIGAGLLFTSLRRLQETPIGVDPTNVLVFRIQPAEVRYGVAEAPGLLDRVIAAIEVVPGVRSVTVDACAPAGTSCASSTLYVKGRPLPGPGQAPPIQRHYIAPDHFKTLGIPVIRGRPFQPSDRRGSPRVVIINETAARRFWPGVDPLGAQVWFGGGSTFSSPDSTGVIVGVVGDVPYGSLEREQVPSFYTPYRQFTYPFRTVMVKTAGDALSLVPSIRTAVRGVDDLPIFEVRTLIDQLGDSWARTRFTATLAAIFAAAALVLAAGGVYGLIAHSVNQRRRELGIRSALGAVPADLLRLVVGKGLVLASVGAVIGGVIAFGLGRVLRGLLYGVGAADPMVFLTQAAILIGTALLASYFPARRAARVDPVTALRAD
jgi:predicted permease